MDADKRYLKKIKAAHLIYKENMPLQEVAKTLGISRPTLTKLVEEMLQEGIVSIQITYPGNTRENLEIANRVRRRYNLRDAVVVDAAKADSEAIIDSIGRAGADYFQDVLRKDMIVGSTGGRSICSLVAHLIRNPAVTGLQIITTTGGSRYVNTKYHANTLVQRLADLLNATGHFIYAPTYADNREQHTSLLNNSQVKSTLEMCKKADVVLAGIAETQTALLYLPKSTEKWVDQKAKRELVGAINTLLIREDGTPLNAPICELFVGLGYDDLKNTGMVIALAGGERKHRAIKAALLGEFVSVLVTDRFTAEYLLT
jgi:deoxyribonucleoside regulator